MNKPKLRTAYIHQSIEVDYPLAIIYELISLNEAGSAGDLSELE